MKLRFSHLADKQLKNLPSHISDRILTKLEWNAQQAQPLHFAVPLTDMPGLYRFRIGEYRAIVSPQGEILSVPREQKRSEIYA